MQRKAKRQARSEMSQASAGSCMRRYVVKRLISIYRGPFCRQRPGSPRQRYLPRIIESMMTPCLPGWRELECRLRLGISPPSQLLDPPTPLSQAPSFVVLRPPHLALGSRAVWRRWTLQRELRAGCCVARACVTPPNPTEVQLPTTAPTSTHQRRLRRIRPPPQSRTNATVHTHLPPTDPCRCCTAHTPTH